MEEQHCWRDQLDHPVDYSEITFLTAKLQKYSTLRYLDLKVLQSFSCRSKVIRNIVKV